MSTQVTTSFKDAFAAAFYTLGQQMKSRLEGAVDVDSGIVGQTKTIDRLGNYGFADQIVSRHADTSYSSAPHSRRYLDLADYDKADLVDELDLPKLIADPTYKYVALIMASLNRRKDKVIYDAMRGNVRTTSGASALPSAQKIAVASSGLTIAKLLAAKEIIDDAEVGDEQQQSIDGQEKPMRFVACTMNQITDLLNTTEVKSSDYNTVKALAAGAIDTFMGFKFIRLNSGIVTASGTTRYAMAWQKGCMRLGIGADVKSSVDVLPGKRMSTQVYGRMSLGAARVEDAGLVEIACLES